MKKNTGSKRVSGGKMLAFQTFLLFVLEFIAWALWRRFAVLPEGVGSALLDEVLIKGLIWALPPLLALWFLRRRQGMNPRLGLFLSPFPWFPCVVLLCLSAAFLYTIRLLNGLQHTFVFLDPMMIVLSLSAGVLEELGFRGGLFPLQKTATGFWPAALLNGALFTLFHYPELLLGGSWLQLVSLRALLIFVMGVAFCWMFHKWRNLALNMTVHTVWNVLSYLFCLAG